MLLPKHYKAPSITIADKSLTQECGVRKWAQAYVRASWKNEKRKRKGTLPSQALSCSGSKGLSQPIYM
jgi:hypothetical protein